MSTLTLARRIASARNYAYEANMGDYSQGSIDRATRAIQELRVEAGEAFETLAVWDAQRGCFLPVEPTPDTLEDAIASDWQGLLDAAPESEEESAPYAPIAARDIRVQDTSGREAWGAIARTISGGDSPAYGYAVDAPGTIPPEPRFARSNRSCAPFEAAVRTHTAYARTMEPTAVRMATPDFLEADIRMRAALEADAINQRDGYRD